MAGYYHLSVSIISRGDGRSAVACAAYRSGESLADNRYGRTQDYGRRGGVEESGIVVPANAPGWARDREGLWNAAESAERRKDAQLAREFVLAFPDGIGEDDRRDLVRTFVDKEITPHGLVADWAIHSPNRAGDERNWHAHVMTTLRAVTPEGFAATKDRRLNAPEQLARWREAWAEYQNQTLERLGLCDKDGRPLRVDHRSFEAQGVDQEPTVHLGVHAIAMERRGRATERGDINRAVRRANEERRESQDDRHRRSFVERVMRGIESRQREHGLDPSP